MRPGALEIRLKDQIEVLDRAGAMVKAGGRIAYITCSVLPVENSEQVQRFITRHPEFSAQPPEETASVLWDKADAFAEAALRTRGGLADDPAADGNRRVFRLHFEEGVTPRDRHSGRVRRANPESITTSGGMDSGLAPRGAPRNDDLDPQTSPAMTAR